MSQDGSLGTLLTGCLAAYLERPVRCTSGNTPPSAGETVLYCTKGPGLRLWLRADALLVSAIADAMIGGEGEGPRVGYGSKVVRVAGAAVSEMMQCVAAALQLPAPGPAVSDRSAQLDFPAIASGQCAIATQTFGWSAGLFVAEAIDAPPVGGDCKVAPAPGAAAATGPEPGVQASQNPDILHAALNGAASALQRMLRRPLKMKIARIEHDVATTSLRGWLRMSLNSRGTGAIVLAVEREAAVALVNCALGVEVVDTRGGALMESGAEVLIRAALEGFADALPDHRDRTWNTLRLSEEAVLAQVPHERVEVTFAAGGDAGTLRWLIPASVVQPQRDQRAAPSVPPA